MSRILAIENKYETFRMKHFGSIDFLLKFYFGISITLLFVASLI